MRAWHRALLALALVCPLLGPWGARAADPPWPTRPVVLVVSYPPGAITDTVGRRLAERLGAMLGQNVVVENRGGAGGNVAAAHVARQRGDDHVLLFTSYGTLIIAAAAELKLDFHPFRDLEPVAMVGPMSVVLLVRPGLPVQDLRSFLAHARANPGRVNFASVGVGSSYHLLIEQLQAYGGLSFNHVPYRGGAAGMADLLGGRVDATLATVLFARPYLNDGRARGIAIANAERAPAMPELPTVGEEVPGAQLTDGLAVLAPATLPPPVVTRLNAALNAIISEPAMHAWLTHEGVTPRPGPPEALSAEMQAAAVPLQRLLAEAGIKLE
ncbi:tripartite tricarboxylate transporter substrate binding protein [Siccirubricoccus sp. KC 17139]|uniref:Tripartite tricarboxylate transporter substrate binding protein n=1 Tax=Siccirubricoccus soli TaxID=2899147 RepID=A0ABT1D2Y7_9PROT|nr:tripartite tricarboxylate transporter substrate binding protein [Siccirubricoccus soli]MCO6415365.1 tripartite tricarboxylate transporter substrate binding protein [Siccirubricoccus soli]MCP2681497.1 tripartite tricarboxylate transporter substrate binding protein [Siccirubricoccus soli]